MSRNSLNILQMSNTNNNLVENEGESVDLDWAEK